VLHCPIPLPSIRRLAPKGSAASVLLAPRLPWALGARLVALPALAVAGQACALRQIKIGRLGESGAYNEHGPFPMPEMWGRVFRYSKNANAGLEAGLFGL
jgi:hypothetical protein